MIGPNGITTLIKNVVGKISDFVHVPYVSSALTNTVMAYLRTGYYHVHGATFLYPSTGAPIQLTSSAAANSETGTIVEIIPANAVTKDFDLHWLTAVEISANLFGYVVLFSGAPGEEVEIGREPISRTDNFTSEMPQYTQVQQIPKNTRISARFVDTTTQSRTCRIWVKGHVYATSLT